MKIFDETSHMEVIDENKNILDKKKLFSETNNIVLPQYLHRTLNVCIFYLNKLISKQLRRI